MPNRSMMITTVEMSTIMMTTSICKQRARTSTYTVKHNIPE